MDVGQAWERAHALLSQKKVPGKSEIHKICKTLKQYGLLDRLMESFADHVIQQLEKDMAQLTQGLNDENYNTAHQLAINGDDYWLINRNEWTWVDSTYLELITQLSTHLQQVFQYATWPEASEQAHKQFRKRIIECAHSWLASNVVPFGFVYFQATLKVFEDILTRATKMNLRLDNELYWETVYQEGFDLDALYIIKNMIRNICAWNTKLLDPEPIWCVNITERLGLSSEMEWIEEDLDHHDYLLLATIQKVREVVKNLDYWDMMLHTAAEVVIRALETKTKTICFNAYIYPSLNICEAWLHHVIFPWIHMIHCGSDEEKSEADQAMLDKWIKNIQHRFQMIYAQFRILPIFSMIVEFPESLAAIDDLKKALEIPGMRTTLTNMLISEINTRLTHHGADTRDILTHYVTMVKYLRILDPSGAILEHAAQPVREYLRSRDDTIRCITEGLVDGTHDELIEDFTSGEIINEEMSDSEDEDREPEKWVPDPIDANPKTSPWKRRHADAITMLVSIYKRRDIFANEFHTVLADRLLNANDYNIDKEVRAMELLKLRFGEACFNACQVMINDFSNSKRFDHYIRDRLSNRIEPFWHPLILSGKYWPEFDIEHFKLPPRIANMYEQTSREFERHKPQRQLTWLPQVGSVEIEVEIGDKTFEFKVQPAYAVVLMKFEEQERWEMDALAEALEMKKPLLQRRLTFWVNRNMLKEVSPGIFVAKQPGDKESFEDIPMGLTTRIPVDTDSTPPVNPRIEKLRRYWEFIENLLRSREALSGQRIHAILKSFMQGHAKFEGTLPELVEFLNLMVHEDKLVFSDNLYRLKPV